MNKTCTKCGIEKPITEFHKHGDGTRPNCKACGVSDALRHRDRIREMWANGELRRPAKKKCPRCGVMKPAKGFKRVTTNRCGLYPYCTDCVRDAARYERRRNVAPYLLRTARGRAMKVGVPFDLEVSDIHVPETCPVLGIRLATGVSGFTDASPSLDRLIPSLGYIKGNVRVISMRANAIKRDATAEELAKILAYMRKELRRNSRKNA